VLATEPAQDPLAEEGVDADWEEVGIGVPESDAADGAAV